jgi:hypothetical protein
VSQNRARRKRWQTCRTAGVVLGLIAGHCCLLGCPKLTQDTSSSSSSAGAGGSGTSGGSTASTRRLDQLSLSELSNECKSINDELNMRFDNRRIVTYDCTRIYVESGDSLACSQAVNDCVAQSPNASPTAARPIDFVIDTNECNTLHGCPVTLGEFDACIADRFDQTDQLIARVSCTIANDPETVEVALSQVDSPRPVPQSCYNIASNCPGIL